VVLGSFSHNPHGSVLSTKSTISRILACPRSVTKMFVGLMSRCPWRAPHSEHRQFRWRGIISSVSSARPAIFRITGREQSIQFGPLVDLGFLLRVAWPVIFANQPTNLLSLQERHHIFEFVMNAARGLLLFIAQKRSELQQVASFDVFDVQLRAGFCE
jgi:hypothetical protein